jgi:hypothetical protein
VRIRTGMDARKHREFSAQVAKFVGTHPVAWTKRQIFARLETGVELSMTRTLASGDHFGCGIKVVMRHGLSTGTSQE